jgi:eukaryotic-like serine/threonine-protein kinase
MGSTQEGFEGHGLEGRTPRRRRPTRPPPPAAEMPRRLGPYRLCMEVGSGGMATVYLARIERSTGLRAFVALKRLRPHLLEQPTLAEMFFDEVTIASQVHHPNVCSVLDFDPESPNHYLAMEYLMGEPLSTVRDVLLRQERPDPARRAHLIARVIADACEGLHAAHEQRDLNGKPLGIVHRDVSPENIFLCFDGSTKIVDFGVACAAGQKHETRVGVVKGKVSYLSPEVVQGHRPDRRADIWALGVVMWEMLTMLRLFRRDSEMETLQAVRRAEVPTPSHLCAGLPTELDAIVLRALAKNPDERFATARELGRALNRALVECGVAIGPAEVGEWMHELLPDGLAHKQQLLEAAAEIEDDPAPAVAEPQLLTVPCAPVAALASASASGPQGTPPPIPDAEELHTGEYELDVLAGPPPWRGRRPLQVLAIAALLLTACFTYRLFASEEHDAAPTAAAEPRPPTSSAGTVVLERGSYVLEIRSTDGGKPQLLHLEVAPPQPAQ